MKWNIIFEMSFLKEFLNIKFQNESKRYKTFNVTISSLAEKLRDLKICKRVRIYAGKNVKGRTSIEPKKIYDRFFLIYFSFVKAAKP